ncbi:MAG: MetS family NSS transporter small subunit [Chlorobi bacterium]|nr:MetS family NSS transporter small subunit [Chlorobiota bacterium]
MTDLWIYTMVFVLAIIWGGFFAALTIAIKKEKGKVHSE